MTTEQKAKAYDDAVKRAKNHRNNDGLTLEQYETIEVIFPELVESEDKKIRKEILEYIKHIEGQTISIKKYNSWLAWLEKQGEQKSVSQKEIDDAYLKGISDAKAELEKQKPIGMKSAEESLGISSEEYNKIIDDCIFGEQSRCEDCSVKTTNCQKSPCVLRDGIKKPVEWSEEDDVMVNDILDAIDDDTAASSYHEMEDWLKALKQRIKG